MIVNLLYLIENAATILKIEKKSKEELEYEDAVKDLLKWLEKSDTWISRRRSQS